MVRQAKEAEVEEEVVDEVVGDAAGEGEGEGWSFKLVFNMLLYSEPQYVPYPGEWVEAVGMKRSRSGSTTSTLPT